MTKRFGGTKLDCPKCKKHSKFHRMTRERAYACQYCGYQLFPCVGTLVEGSRTPLYKWFYAMFLFASSRHGVAAKELERQLGLTYKAAWRMAHKIRKYMAIVDGNHPLTGTIEVDETYIGGKAHGKRGRGAQNKSVVFGMLERQGDVRTEVVRDVKARTLYPIITGNVESGSMVHSDELSSYTGLPMVGYPHRTVNHVSHQYVNGDCHVNGIEGFWSRLKLSIRGTHVHVSRKHLGKYAKEFAYRYNRRKQPSAIFDDLMNHL